MERCAGANGRGRGAGADAPAPPQPRTPLLPHRFAAWRTGLTLNHVQLRPEALEPLQLPVRLVRGSVGRVQAQVPWRALRSPVVVELSGALWGPGNGRVLATPPPPPTHHPPTSPTHPPTTPSPKPDVYICLQLRGGDELDEQGAGERAWLAKQAELVAAELAELAPPGPAAHQQQQPPTGVLWSFLQHLLGMLVNRLQLSVGRVHVRLEDPATGTAIGLRLERLHTCLPGEAEHVSLLLNDQGGGSEGGRRALQKQFAVDGVSLYWVPGAAPGAPATAAADADAAAAAAVDAALQGCAGTGASDWVGAGAQGGGEQQQQWRVGGARKAASGPAPKPPICTCKKAA